MLSAACNRRFQFAHVVSAFVGPNNEHQPVFLQERNKGKGKKANRDQMDDSGLFFPPAFIRLASSRHAFSGVEHKEQFVEPSVVSSFTTPPHELNRFLPNRSPIAIPSTTSINRTSVKPKIINTDGQVMDHLLPIGNWVAHFWETRCERF